jgi:hypothetical protein
LLLPAPQLPRSSLVRFGLFPTPPDPPARATPEIELLAYAMLRQTTCHVNHIYMKGFLIAFLYEAFARNLRDRRRTGACHHRRSTVHQRR